MNRLTERIMDNVYYLKGKYPPATLCAEMETWEVRECMAKLAAYEDTGLEPEEISKLIKEYNKDSTIAAHYEQLEEQGLLIKLPCKVDSDVYLIHNICNGKWTSIEKVKFKINLYNCFGKTVFLTREEAEKTLKIENE